jgi:hypothetical protein
MQFSSWPRHQLRAQGSRNRHPQDAILDDQEFSQPRRRKDSASQATQLLNFLSRTAAQSQKQLLAPVTVPEFARVKSISAVYAGKQLDQLILRNRSRMRRANARVVETYGNGLNHIDSLLGQLADTITQCAKDTAQPSDLCLVALYEENEQLEHCTTDGGITCAHEKSWDCLADLDKWLSGGPDSQELDEFCHTDDLNDLSRSAADLNRAGALPAALPPVLPSVFNFSSLEEPLAVGVNVDMYEPTPPLSEAPKTERVPRNTFRKGGSRYKRALFNRHVLYRPRTITLPDGARRERFDNGAELAKDALGRVVEIRCANGSAIIVHYDEEGQLKSFTRAFEDGGTHSMGERDSHGVVVRDSEGRVRAACESMAVDQGGCLSVRRFDGQFWTLDLVRGVHIERRCVNDKDGRAHVLTALFAFDGFRMVTRFQPVAEDSPSGDASHKWLAQEPSGTFRFYGRDGSVVQFDSEDDLVALNPSRVWQPGSRLVASDWRGYHQAGTAWESVQEYVANYLLA